ncbi:hypothetical protein B7982_12940 [Fibrobacter sp. UWB2]|jgi:hypothetical protein|uniref:PorV/PorQ family protein n=1 Tax=Fibrobacter succinogenes TaxID=833 RepID=A0A380S692_FIBSU|nr:MULTISPECIES: hypothetical protein [Fibrobacter]OWV21147.1 hypothetical protein B7982_12940 [Fibrobacter sp. UWB2]PWJ35365.1 hypothetical protein IE02_1411 [Fibrobacter succinogenes subsp. elongatus]SUQ24021.1 hypothetical protein SAMN05661053_1411 [Fibrobacter succinogenes]
MIMFKNLLVTALAVGTLASSALALGFTKKSELGGFDGFVERMGAGVRELGRGNTGSADTASMPAAYWNPALLGFRENIGITMNFEKRDLNRIGGALGVEGKVGKRMGVGFAMLYRGDTEFDVIDDDDETLGTAAPFFSMFYLGFAFRATRQDAFGLSLSMSYDNLDVSQYFEGYDMEDSFRSPVTINLSWFRQWNDKWSSSVVIRNLSFSRNLSAKWTKNPSKNNALTSTEGVRPKVLQIGLGYRSQIMGKTVHAWMEALDYQVADTLLAFDPQLHVWTGRVGFECEVIPNGTLRVGMDDLDWMFGAGYKFEIRVGRKKFPIEVDYAFLYESRAGIWTPFTIGLRGYIP